MNDPNDEAAADLVQPGNRFNLRQAFLRRQEQLLATLGIGRSVGDHPVAIGDDLELNWRGMLQSILPTRYQVSKAFVIDVEGNRSEQIDVLIYDRHFSPVLLDVGDYLFVPVESVFAAFEVKPLMNRDTVMYAANKAASVTRLHRTSAQVPYVEGKYNAKDLNVFSIIRGLLTVGTDWSPALGHAFEKALEDSAGGGRLDIGCALRSASFEVQEDGSILRSDGDAALIFFVLRLLRRLQQMGSPPAMDYDTYDQVITRA